MRMIAGLDRPSSGTVRVNGKHYPKAPAPMAELGILLPALTTGLRGTGTAISFPHGFVTALTGGTP